VYRFIFLWLLSFTNAFSQTFFSQQFNLSEGLPQAFVTSIKQDPNGYLWVGTAAGGLSRFDGLHFKNFGIDDGLPSLFVNDIIVYQNQLWVSTNKGLCRFNGKSFEKIRLPKTISNTVTKRLIATENELYILLSNDEFWKRLPNNQYVHLYSMPKKYGVVVDLVDVKKEHWFLTHLNYIIKVNYDSFTIKKISGRILLSLIKTKNDSLLVCDRNTVYQTDLKFKSKKIIPIPDSVTIARKIFSFNNQYFLFTDKGFFFLKDKTFQPLKTNLNQREISATFFFEDKEGTGWVGTNQNGLFKFTTEPIRKVNINGKEFNGLIVDILKLKNNQLLISEYRKGNFLIDDNTVKKIDVLPSYAVNYGNLGDTLVFITPRNEIVLIHQNKIIPNPEFLSKLKSPSYIIERFKDSLLISNFKEIYTLKKNELKLYATFNNAYCFVKAGKKDFFGTENGIVVKKGNGLKKCITKTTLDNAQITMMYAINDSIVLIGTEGLGLWSAKVKNDSLKVIDRSYTNGRITFITKGKYFYVGTQVGVSVMEVTTEGKVKSKIHLGNKNGFTGIETVDYNFAFHPTMGLLIGSVNGLYQLDESAIKFDLSKPILKITSIEGKNLPTANNNWFNVPTEIVWPYNVKDIRIAFKTVSLRSADEFVYSYRLTGLMDDWTDLGKTNSLSFPELSPGNYKLEIRTNHVDEPQIVTLHYAFTIEKPWWLTHTFLILALLLFIYSVYLIIKYRINYFMISQQKINDNQRAMRKELAKDFHDELGNHLASIISNMQYLKINENTLPDNLKTRFNSLEKHASNLFFGTKDFIAAIDPEHESLDWVLSYIKDFGDELFGNSDIYFDSLPLHPWLKSRPIKSVYSRNIILIFKEAMTNALKHSRAEKVKFSFYRKNVSIYIILEDNGIGFTEGISDTNGFGINNMRERASKIEATLTIENNNPGVKIILFKENYNDWNN